MHCKYVLKVCSNFFPTYELHISLSGRKKKTKHLYCLGEDPQILHILRDLRVSYNGISEFYFGNLSKLWNNGWTKNLRQVLDLIFLSFNYSRSKWRLRSPKVEANIWVSLKVRSVHSNLEENFGLNACVLLKSESIDAIAQGRAKVKLGGVCWW